jgi:putative ABC transport system permease protein
MWRATVAGVVSNARRFAATAVAVVLGVGFVVGTLIFTDTAEAGFSDAFARVARNVDVSILRPGRTAGETPTLLRASDLAAIRAVPGVASADGRLTESLALLDRAGRPITNFGRTGLVVCSDGRADLLPFTIAGRIPAGAGEAAVDTETAAHQRLAVGDAITVLDRGGVRHTFHLTGLIDFGVSSDYSGSTVVALPHQQIAALTAVTGYDEIVVAAAPGVRPGELAARVRDVVEDQARVETGDERRADLTDEAVAIGGQFTVILLIFAAIALLMAVFVIYNTFAVLVAQRVRDTALLRCVGASRTQVFLATTAEAGAVGAAGAFGGLLIGVGVAYGLQRLLSRLLGIGVPDHDLVVSPQPLLVGALVGLVVTIVSALLPAWRATRTSPLGALRDLGPAFPSRRGRRIRVVAAAVALAAGVAITFAGQRTGEPRAGTLLIAAGAVAVVVAVLIAGPLFIGPLLTLLAWPARSVLGVPGRLAVANSRRNPGRSAATTATLIIGIGLISLFTILIASIRATVRDQIANHYPVDYAITGLSYFNSRQSTLPPALAATLRHRPEMAAVAEIRTVATTIDGHPARIAAVDPRALGTVVKPSGYAGLTDDSVILSTSMLASSPPATITLDDTGTPYHLHVIATTDLSLPGVGHIDALVTWDRLTALHGGDADTAVLAKAAAGVPPTESRDAVDQVTAAYPLAYVNSVADLTSDLESVVNGLIAVFAGLVATAVLIALAGIANTLSLSIVERTRESAILRALGLTRVQLLSTLVVEAILMAVAGAIIGIGVGLIFGPLVVGKLATGMGAVVTIPWTWQAVLTGGAAAAGCIAALVPARKATRAPVAATMADD